MNDALKHTDPQRFKGKRVSDLLAYLDWDGRLPVWLEARAAAQISPWIFAIPLIIGAWISIGLFMAGAIFLALNYVTEYPVPLVVCGMGMFAVMGGVLILRMRVLGLLEHSALGAVFMGQVVVVGATWYALTDDPAIQSLSMAGIGVAMTLLMSLLLGEPRHQIPSVLATTMLVAWAVKDIFPGALNVASAVAMGLCLFLSIRPTAGKVSLSTAYGLVSAVPLMHMIFEPCWPEMWEPYVSRGVVSLCMAIVVLALMRDTGLSKKVAMPLLVLLTVLGLVAPAAVGASFLVLIVAYHQACAWLAVVGVGALFASVGLLYSTIAAESMMGLSLFMLIIGGGLMGVWGWAVRYLRQVAP